MGRGLFPHCSALPRPVLVVLLHPLVSLPCGMSDAPPDLPAPAQPGAHAADDEDEDVAGPHSPERVQRLLWDAVRRGDFVSAWYWLDQVRV